MPNRTAAQIAVEARSYYGIIHRASKHKPHCLATFRRLQRASKRGRIDKWSAFVDYSGYGVKKGAMLSQLKVHLAALQNNRCCYCRSFLQNISYAKPIEHILPRSIYPQFSMEYFNLALACFNCNQAKKIQNWSSLPKRARRYYRHLAPTNFFHPRFHDYNEHIAFEHRDNNSGAYFIYVGRTSIGRRLCKDLLAQVAKEMMLVRNNAALVNAIETMHRFNDSDRELPLNALRDFVEELDRVICDVA
jgi:uncharacterized protein (TIGR02646 family)